MPPLSRAILRTVITCAVRFRHSVFTSAIGIGPVIQSYPFQRVVGTVYGDVREGGAAGGSLQEHGAVHLSLRVDRIHTHPLLLLASRPLYPRLLRRHGLDLRRPLSHFIVCFRTPSLSPCAVSRCLGFEFLGVSSSLWFSFCSAVLSSDFFLRFWCVRSLKMA